MKKRIAVTAPSTAALAAAFAVTILAAGAAVATGDDAKGSIVYRTNNVALKYAWLVKGPDSMQPGKTIRKLVLSATDISAKLAACNSLSCADGAVTEGTTIDFDVGPRLNYWLAVNGQKVQYSGAAMPSALAGKVNDGGHLAGRLFIDDVSAGGPKIEAQFDVAVSKEYKSAR
jgi:hypothetical protein